MRRFTLLVCAALQAFPAHAVDGMLLQWGEGSATEEVRAGAVWQWDSQWFDQGDWKLSGYWEAEIGQWQSRNAVGNQKYFTDIGFTPVFRFEQKFPSALVHYLEGAIGAHLITPVFNNTNRRFSTAFQFGNHIGIGMRFGARRQFDLAYRLQHLSNGAIKKHNPGINFNQVNLMYWF